MQAKDSLLAWAGAVLGVFLMLVFVLSFTIGFGIVVALLTGIGVLGFFAGMVSFLSIIIGTYVWGDM